jgi:hypothetical protein
MRFGFRAHFPADRNPFSAPKALESSPLLTVEVRLVLKAASTIDTILVSDELLVVEQQATAPLRAHWENGKLITFEAGGLGKLGSVVRDAFANREDGDPTLINSRWLLRYMRPTPHLMRLRLDASALRSDTQLSVSRHGRLLGLTGEGLPLAVERLRRTTAWRRILAGLQQVYPRIEDVQTVHLLPGQVALKFKERDIEEGLGQGNVSDGVIHALALLVALEGSPKWSTLAIEEPENALHPWALRQLMSRAEGREIDGSLLMTTHSPTLIDAINDPASLFIVENNADEGTKITPARQKSDALDAILADSGEKLGQLWLDGFLGGTP